MTKVALTGAALLWAGLVAADDDCAFTAERTAEESADGIERLEIRAGAGDLNVEGENGLRSVYVTGSACARTEAQLDRVQLRLVREGRVVPRRFWSDRLRYDQVGEAIRRIGAREAVGKVVLTP